MKSIKGTQTEKNLMHSYVGESQARMRYTFFASKAKSEGFVQIADIFSETADQEKEHGKRFFKFLEGGMLEVFGAFPAGVIGTTAENLKAAAEGEHGEWALDYPKFADIADREGFPEIATVFRNVAVAEKQHEKRYLGLLADRLSRMRAPASALRTARRKLVISRSAGEKNGGLVNWSTGGLVKCDFCQRQK